MLKYKFTLVAQITLLTEMQKIKGNGKRVRNFPSPNNQPIQRGNQRLKYIELFMHQVQKGDNGRESGLE